MTEAELTEQIQAKDAEIATLKEEVKQKDATILTLRTDRLLARAGEVIAEEIGKADLAEPTKERLAKLIDPTAAPSTEGEDYDLDEEKWRAMVTEAITAEAKYAADLIEAAKTGTGVPSGADEVDADVRRLQQFSRRK